MSTGSKRPVVQAIDNGGSPDAKKAKSSINENDEPTIAPLSLPMGVLEHVIKFADIPALAS